MFFVIACVQSLLTASRSSPGAREPISVAIPFDLLWKKRAMMQKANGGHEKKKMDKRGKKVRRLTCVGCFKVVKMNTFVVRCYCQWKEKK
jgi:hypothetical protein